MRIQNRSIVFSVAPFKEAPLPINYVQRLRAGLDALPPASRKIRAAVTEHFPRLNQGARNDLRFSPACETVGWRPLRESDVQV